MRLGSSNILGLAFDERGVSCADVAVDADKRVCRRLGRFDFPSDAGLAHAQACGAALSLYLKSHNFDSRRAIIGVPARWVISQLKDLQPTDRASTIDMLRLQAERLGPGGSELVVDVAGDALANVNRAMLIGILRPQYERLLTVASAAQLNVAAITSTTLALQALMTGQGETPLMLLTESGAELVAGDASSPRALRHLSSSNASQDTGADQLAGDLRRAIALGTLGGGTNAIRLWDGLGIDASRTRWLGDRAGVTIQPTPAATSLGLQIDSGALNGEANRSSPVAFLPAIALACGRAADLSVNFVAPRLAPPRVKRFGRKAIWAAALTATAIIGIVALYQAASSRETEADEYEAQLNAIDPDAKAAEATINRIAYGRTYFENRPPMLAAIREVGSAFPFDEPIWALSFRFGDNRKGEVQGKTTDQRLAFALRDRLMANPNLREVQLQDLRQAGGSGSRGEQSFSISFIYTGTE